MTAPRELACAQAFGLAILDARREAQARLWAPWIAQAQREAAPLAQAVRVLATRSLDPGVAANGPALRAENGPSTDNSHNNGHESAARSRGPRIGRSTTGEREPAQVRGPVAERVIVSSTLDPWMSLRALAAYTGLSVRTLRERLLDPTHPLPHYRVGGKVLVRRSDYDAWALRHRQVGAPDVDRVVAEVLRELR